MDRLEIGQCLVIWAARPIYSSLLGETAETTKQAIFAVVFSTFMARDFETVPREQGRDLSTQ